MSDFVESRFKIWRAFHSFMDMPWCSFITYSFITYPFTHSLHTHVLLYPLGDISLWLFWARRREKSCGLMIVSLCGSCAVRVHCCKDSARLSGAAAGNCARRYIGKVCSFIARASSICLPRPRARPTGPRGLGELLKLLRVSVRPNLKWWPWSLFIAYYTIVSQVFRPEFQLTLPQI